VDQTVTPSSNTQPGQAQQGWLQILQAKARAHNIPLHVMLELTNRCNVWCRHCYISDRSPADELNLAEFENILTQLAAAGTLFLVLSGGEPLMHSNFFEIAARARQKEFSLTLFSNATLITPKIADRLAELCLERVEISLLGGRAATHDGITQVPGSFDKTLRGARLLMERGISIQFKTTWMRENIEEAAEIQTLVTEMEASFRSAFLVIHRRDGDPSTADLRATPAQLRAMAQQNYDRRQVKAVPPEPAPLDDSQKEANPCGMGQISCRVDSYGNVYPCAAVDIVLGNLRQEKFASIWHSSEELKRLRSIRIADLTECSSCELFSRCSRCAGLARMETGSLLGPSPQACIVARAFEGFYQEQRCELQ
jgi:radical SAM protein with 4Fe4S-binding SPASM domain